MDHHPQPDDLRSPPEDLHVPSEGPEPSAAESGEAPDGAPSHARHPRRRLALYSAMAGLLTGTWFLWNSPFSAGVTLPAPGAFAPRGVDTVFLLSLLENVRDAKPIVREERQRAAAEREAFDRFSREVSELYASQPGPAIGGDGGILAIDAGPDDGRVEAVERTYRETVLSVAHAGEEYDESTREHMAAELGEELVASLVVGRGLTPQLRTALAEASAEAAEQRDALVRTLDRESEALTNADRVMTAVEEEIDRFAPDSLHHLSFDELSDAWLRLRGLERRCERLLADRQHRIREGHAIGLRAFDGRQLHRYLYQSMDVSHPVLADGMRMVERVQDARHRLTRAITRRV